MKTISVVFKKPNQLPQIMEVEDDLRNYQKMVGGYIELVPFLQEHDILVVVNEEGKIRNLQPNIMNGFDVLVGNIIFVGSDGEDFRSLTKDEMEFILDQIL